jgi:hypothetical protein
MRPKSKTESQSPALNPSSLARIRENQRRSRATRKAYLQSLETKYQKCVQDGVSASMEIQAAARKVEKENRALRALLRDKGVGEEEIAMAVTMALGGEEGGRGLDGLLKRRVECCEGESSRVAGEMEVKEGSEGLYRLQMIPASGLNLMEREQRIAPAGLARMPPQLLQR